MRFAVCLTTQDSLSLLRKHKVVECTATLKRMHSYPQTRFFALSSPFELAQPAPSAPSSHGAMVSVDSSTRAAGPDAVAIGRKRNVVKMRRVQAIGNGQPIIGNGPRTLSGKRPTAAALRLERLDCGLECGAAFT